MHSLLEERVLARVEAGRGKIRRRPCSTRLLTSCAASGRRRSYMENVFALGYRNQNRPVFERFVSGVIDAGYSFDRQVLIAADYGVPQLRQRLFCVGVREIFSTFQWTSGGSRGQRQLTPDRTRLVPGETRVCPGIARRGKPIRPSRRPESSRARGGRDRDVRGGACGDSAGRQLSLLDGEAGPSDPPFQVAFAVLDFPAQARL